MILKRILKSTPCRLADLATEEASDPVLRNIIKNLRAPTQATSAKSKHLNYDLRPGSICEKNFDPTGRPFFRAEPRQRSVNTLKALHDNPTSGHLDFVRKYVL